MSRSGGRNEQVRLELLKKIDEYKKTIQKKPIVELEALYKEEKAKELKAIKQKSILDEQSRFFNQSSSNADFSDWSKMAHWSLDEAVALSFGKNPKTVN